MKDDQLYYCRTCKHQLPLNFEHNASHDIVPLEWVKFCGECGREIENDWSYCAYCGEHFSDW